MQRNKLEMYTDGSARGNPGPGGYGVILLWGDVKKELSAGYRLTTNNRMELLAVITGLEALKKRDMFITIYTDSQYVFNTVEKGWLKSWMANHFKGKKNKDLWLRYFAVSQGLNIKFQWVKGHADNYYNNACDKLATEAAAGSNLLIDEGYENREANLL